ncbi:sensor histidine kinase [Clostridium sp. 'deep sea']|uniref:sensor histidine kinase n=1 Tax=Clostridium sp. 'deep sea' TaxID=2779445 RepID=UPI001896A1EA|nr:sensor histidine kinase [Clostridium sp. 'deep sea']QOR35478.1 sensor histidine kinase [Clostridium sp. 'deep sea']
MCLTLMQYLNKRKLIIIAWFINTLLSMLFFALVLDSNTLYLYPCLISAFILTLVIIIDYLQFKSFKNNVTKACENPLYEAAENLRFNNEVLNSISNIHIKYIGQISEINEKNKEKNIFFSKWVHEMKTPITVINLILEKLNNKSNIVSEVNEIAMENNKLLKYVNDSLNFIRLDDFATDYKPQKVALDKLVKEIINDNKKSFIYSGIFPKIEISTHNCVVLTDYKWSKFIINQVVSNALKYTKLSSNTNNTILFRITSRNNTTELKIKDFGIGIAKHDLHRVFNPFFTGEIGKQQKRATGMGLYLCKSIAEKLNHHLNIESQENIGTEVTIIF